MSLDHPSQQPRLQAGLSSPPSPSPTTSPPPASHAPLLDASALPHGEPGFDGCFMGSFTQQEAIPDEAIAAATSILRSGRLHRYNVAAGESSETALLEQEFAATVGAKYALAVTSGGYALATALRAIGVGHGDRVLTNGFTLAPVPGAIAGVGATPVLVEITGDLTIDLADLERKAISSGAKTLLLSHMRGHLADMDKLSALADRLGLTVIEDCAHTMGAAWGDKPSGRFGLVGCFSTQTYKHINSGEGGFLITDDADVMARAIILSGSYMLYERHLAAPSPECFKDIRLETPNCSGRMDNLRAAILRPQLAKLSALCDRWNALYDRSAAILAACPLLTLRTRPLAETYVGSSIQFRVPSFSPSQIEQFVTNCATRGVELKWFGPDEPVAFTSRHVSWQYMPQQALPATDAILATLLDMRLPLTFSTDDVALISRIIIAEAERMSGDMST